MKNSLPDKWCILDCKEVSQYGFDNFKSRNVVSDKYLHPDEDTIKGFNQRVLKNYTEITLDQFKQYVLKEISIDIDYSYLIPFLKKLNIK